jgi:hypothetical protein
MGFTRTYCTRFNFRGSGLCQAKKPGRSGQAGPEQHHLVRSRGHYSGGDTHIVTYMTSQQTSVGLVLLCEDLE